MVLCVLLLLLARDCRYNIKPLTLPNKPTAEDDTGKATKANAAEELRKLRDQAALCGLHFACII